MDFKSSLGDSISTIKGIGEATSARLQKLKIESVYDLVHHYPTRYLDYSSPKVISELKSGDTVSFIATISSVSSFYTKTKKSITQATAQDKTGKIKLTWFNNPYIKKLLVEDQIYTVAGKVSIFAGKSTIISPTLESVDSFGLNTHGFVPIYPLTQGITSKWLRSKIYQILNNIYLDDPLKLYIDDLSLVSIQTAYNNIHFPPTKHDRWMADKRLSFNEHLAINLQNVIENSKLGDSVPIKINRSIDSLLNKKIPFQLTPDQEKTINSIYKDLSKNTFTHRLIQGDTGSGKTITLVYAADQCLNDGKSVVIMAPTELLAEQHFRTFTAYSIFNNNLQLVTGSTDREIQNHKPMIYIGTHALITKLPEKLDFPISLIAIDEQHKFGVKQREALRQRTPVPHLINLSATPIPRTVALGLIGDLSISNIKSKPLNRLPTTTHIVSPQRYKNSTKWLKSKISEGNNVFVVCPNISDTNQGVSSVEAITKEYQKKFSPETKVLSLHGRISQEEQNNILEYFRTTPSCILVSTSLIEVGIDIPSANIMVIHSAERFGLAQLHQLRGRVGRGDKPSFCFLVPTSDDDIETERLKLLQKYTSGLVLAQKDLRLRGAGELFGIKQHGSMATRLKYFWSKTQFTKAKSLANSLFTNDSSLAITLLDKLNQA